MAAREVQVCADKIEHFLIPVPFAYTHVDFER